MFEGVGREERYNEVVEIGRGVDSFGLMSLVFQLSKSKEKEEAEDGRI
jgi:hypothetical protein